MRPLALIDVKVTQHCLCKNSKVSNITCAAEWKLIYLEINVLGSYL